MTTRSPGSFDALIVALGVHARWTSKFAAGGPDDCWPWLAGGDHHPGGLYGRFWRAGRTDSAHRIALEMKLGRRLRVDEEACHACDNPPCVNPAHLWAGSKAENQVDKGRKGRAAKGDDNGSRLYPERLVRGDRHHGAKLREVDIPVIRALARDGWRHRDIAARFGVSRPAISFAVRGQTWGHV